MAEALSSQSTQTFPDFLSQMGISLLVSTYQAGKLILLRPENGGLNTHFTSMTKPMGIALKENHLAIGTGFELAHYYNIPAAAEKVEPYNTHNACYIPRETHITGDIDIHEMGFTDENELWLVNTRMSCLCTISPEYSVVPRWKPPFISAYDLTDRCHLNGLTMKDGQPTYVSALGTTDTAAGWRKDKAHGGMLMDIRDNRIVTSNLSMPHSPRWYQDKLWVLESGAGSLATVDIETGKLTTIVELPGFTRGIDFIGRYAVIGLSQVRETAVFAGLPLTERCKERQCGVYIVDIVDKKVVGFVVFSGEVQEIFSVQIIPASFPTILTFDDPLLRTTYSIPDEALKTFSAPDPIQTALEKANVLLSRRQFDEAIPAFKSLLKDAPENSMGRYHLGLAYLDSMQWQKAVDTFEIVLKNDPKHADAQLSLGKAWGGLENWDKALASFNNAIEIDLQFATAYYHRALVLLKQRKYQKAWQDLEWRWKMPNYTPLSCAQSQWQGEDISDKTLLVHTEQNLAENIQFARFLPQLASLCGKIIVLCSEPQRLFFKAIDGVDEVRLPDQNWKESFDVFTPIVSITAILDISKDSIPSHTPYWIIPKEVAVPVLKSERALSVGLEWKSDLLQQTEEQTNSQLESLLSLIQPNETDITFYSLQASLNNFEIDLLENKSVKSLESEMVSHAHTGALIDQLDLVICIDSSIAHLSSSLGKNTWILDTKDSSWVWNNEKISIDWYPSTKLFSQSRDNASNEPNPIESLLPSISASLSKLLDQE